MMLFDLDAECEPEFAERKRSSPRLVRAIMNIFMRTLLFCLDRLLRQPFGAILAVLSLWCGMQVAHALFGQAGPHPAPLFQKQEFATKIPEEIPATLFQVSVEEQPQVEAPDMRGVQEKLSASGFYKGALDGRPGPMTMEALRAFQAREGIKITGTADAETLSRLREQAAPAAEEADDILVFTVQNRLNELGFDAGAANGRLNRQTHEAIRKFEAAHGLPVTGTIRGQLLGALTAANLGANPVTNPGVKKK